MAELRRRVSQLAELAERLALRERGRQGQMLADVVEVLRELALDVEEVSQNQLELEDYLEEIDSDLMSVEEEVYLDDDAEMTRLDGESNDPDAASYIELECPVCERESSYNQILFDQDGIQLTCPHCGNVVFDSDEDCLVLDGDDDDAWDPNDAELFD
ncbi:MAG: hypothetical protein C7B45_00590 [Sulfobacillus acidophilus]|uniref:AraC family transcriptional regulator n=1 Tax=Sulfobacillus acidophilus TaxID=53633 RepID=A0A2T2WPJ3_9FIRM|nr:MAG: hypothetical protein C7B45_00590 [Sulfobacillus acidophilus]